MHRFTITFLPILLAGIMVSPTTVRAQTGPDYWDVISIIENSDTLTVGLEMHGVYGCPYNCFVSNFSRLEVSPCPLDTECSGDLYILVRTTNINEIIYLKLLKGYQYTFSGLWNDVAQTSGTGGRCSIGIVCGEFLQPLVFPDDYVATETSSWGAIKALYK